MTWLQLANKTAIVTGAASGIGAAGKLIFTQQVWFAVFRKLSSYIHILISRPNIIDAKLSRCAGGSG